MRTSFRYAALSILVAAAALAGCLADNDPDSPATGSEDYSDLDLTSATGGYTAKDEAPGFGDPEIAKLEDENGDEEFSGDELEDGELDDDGFGVGDLAGGQADGVVHYLRVRWGHLEGDPTADARVDWTGSIAVDRGAIRILRVAGFEEGDHLVLPRTERSRIEFVSHTTTRWDGLLLRVVTRNDMGVSTEPNTITFSTGPLTRTFDVAQLDGLAEIVEVEPAGNAVSFRGISRKVLPCENGELSGFWRVDPLKERGRFGGTWASPDGRPTGFVKGHFGVNAAGEKVLFGKIISRSGAFLGFLRGSFTPDGDRGGTFDGHWLGRGMEIGGEISGFYRVAESGARGSFEGSWTTSCPARE